MVRYSIGCSCQNCLFACFGKLRKKTALLRGAKMAFRTTLQTSKVQAMPSFTLHPVLIVFFFIMGRHLKLY